MSRLKSAKRTTRRLFTSILFFVVLGLVLGALIAIPLIPRPYIATITISGTITGQDYVDDILDALRYARDNDSIKAVVLKIDSPGGGASASEQIYLDVLQLRQRKPVVTSVGTIAASGGYYVAIASNFIYAEPTSVVGSVGAWMTLPAPEEPDEITVTTGRFKLTGSSQRKSFATLETFRQQFVAAVISHRGENLKLPELELTQAAVYTGTESLSNGLIDDIGTSTAAIEKAASLARVKNYGVMELSVEEEPIFLFFSSADLESLKTRTGLVPAYYYLYFESE